VSLDESEFHKLADTTLLALATAIDDALGDSLDVDEQGGILTIGLPDGGQYILNKNAPMRQIWLSSPKSGAWHFDWNEGQGAWVSSRGSEGLTEVLGGELEVGL